MQQCAQFGKLGAWEYFGERGNRSSVHAFTRWHQRVCLCTFVDNNFWGESLSPRV